MRSYLYGKSFELSTMGLSPNLGMFSRSTLIWKIMQPIKGGFSSQLPTSVPLRHITSLVDLWPITTLVSSDLQNSKTTYNDAYTCNCHRVSVHGPEFP